MANGPMGGFMPTPAAPAQPPQVKLDTTADSRGNFNNFLKSMNGAMSLNPPSMAPSMGAASPMLAPASNIDIFNQPVQMMFTGGEVDDFGDFASAGDFSVGGGGFGGTGGNEESFQQALDDPKSTSFDAPATDIFADDAQASVGTNVGLEKSGGFSAGVQKDVPGRFTAFRSPSFAMRGLARDFRTKINDAGDDGITVANYFNTFNPSDDNAPRLAEFESLTGKKAGDKLNIGDMKNIMNVQAKYEAGIRNVPDSVQNTILSTVNIDDDRKVEDILGNLDLGRLDTKDPSRAIDVFENIVPNPAVAQRNFQAGLPGVNLPNVGTTRSTVAQDQARAIANLVGGTPPLTDVEKGLQQNQQALLAQRGRALGPTTFDDDLASFPTRQTLSPPPEGFEENVGVSGALRQGDRIFAPGQTEMRFTTKGTTPKEQAELRELRDIDEAIEVAGRGPLGTQNLQSRTALGGRGQSATTTTTTLPEDFEENVGLPFSAQRMRDIERLYNLPVGQTRVGEGDDPNFFANIPSGLNIFETLPREQMAIDVALGRPRGLGEMIRGFTAPNIGMGQTQATDKETIEQFNQRTGRSIPENQLVRNNTGRIIAVKDASGRTVTGVDPDEQIPGGDDNQTPIIRRPIVAKEEEKDEDRPPNIIGGGTPLPVPEIVPTVVASPFAPSDATFNPVTFDTGDLNKLIEALTGIAAKPVVAKQEGGLVSAVDEFLASGS